MALKPENPVVGGDVLRRAAIQSPNYVPGVSGWTIKQDGSAEFNNMTVRGTFNGTNYVINNAGEFFYSAAPAAGNLVESVTNAAGTDAFGNIYLRGHAAYAATFATSMDAGLISYYLGSLAGGWTLQGELEISLVDGHLVLNFTTTEVAGALTVDGNLTISGSTITASGVSAINFDVATIDLKNGNLNLNMADPPNTAAVIAGTATQAQYNACLGGMLNSMKNRQMFA